ncbi:MAG: sigma-54 dependent transcriptional regulator [Planctomycetota bacterium]|nr:sigma-54 dependent transcriptional regulator [Planctomycetota bacterium]
MKILFADDEKSLQELMRTELPRMGHEVTVCKDGTDAVQALSQDAYDCLLVDLNMPGLNGIEVIEKAREISPKTDSIVLTGKGSFESAIASIRNHVYDYLMKPCKLIELENLLQRIAEKRDLQNERRALEHQVERLQGSERLIGKSPRMQQVNDLITKVAATNSTVLILGETGTGKELVARELHDQSKRSTKPFVPINCGALPENLIESELFGHRKGAFTGADDHRKGLFEVASGGTLFLDEIGELPKAMQAKLLRFLESGEIRRVGENTPVIVDVRVLCATHRNLTEMVANDQFREDLMFRINTFEITLPALRERIEDLPALVEHLLGRFTSGISSKKNISSAAIDVLMAHRWPGNIRELANAIQHATILCDSETILPEHLPTNFDSRFRKSESAPTLGTVSLRDLEMQAIDQALERNQGNKPKTAEELGISLKTLYNKLNQAILKESA